jgi:hypothetical protein
MKIVVAAIGSRGMSSPMLISARVYKRQGMR